MSLERRIGIQTIGVIPISAGGGGGVVGGIPAFDFDLAALTFTQRMAVRVGPNGTFAGAPIIQGNLLDTTQVSDVLAAASATLIGNPTQQTFYEVYDGNQGSISVLITPEWDGNDSQRHDFLDTGNCYIYKETSNLLYVNFNDGGAWTSMTVDISAWTAGTPYLLVVRWDCDNTLDGTNYCCASINNSHNYGITSALTPTALAASLVIGNESADHAADAVLEGLTVYRRVLTANDGTGVPVPFNASGPIDELTAIYAAGAGVDPCTVTGSWDVVFCLPTNSTYGQLTATGQAWSHPHSSSLINQDLSFPWDGGYLGGPYMVYFDGANDEVNFGSDASIDDIPSGASITGEGIWRIDAIVSNSNMISKGSSNGWQMRVTAGGNLFVYMYTAGANVWSEATPGAFGLDTFKDGKCHHFAFVYDDTGDRKAYLAVDGRWASSYTTQVAAGGVYSSDAAHNLYTGEYGGVSNDFTGAHGWLRLSSSRRYTPGTDFIAPRNCPAADGTTIEQWLVSQGTGNLTAVVNTPANDGVRTGATWIAAWNLHGTPVVPQSVEFNGTTTNLDATSGANIDNLPSGANGFTAEGCFRHDDEGESNNGTFWNKTSWYMRFNAADTVRVFIDYDNTDIDETFTWIPDGQQHHWALTYNENGADRFARVWRDGVLVHTTAASVGNYVADAAQTLYIGNNAAGSATMDGAIGWQRMSDNVRYSASFVPDARTNPPANDANAHLLYNMTDGAGASVTDTSGNAYTGTLSNYVWNNTPDLEIDEPGKLKFGRNGYNIGSDLANDGLHIYSEMIDASDYVIRPIVEYPNSSRGQARITIYDVIGGAPLVQFTGPNLTGVHDGGAAQPNFTDTGNFYPASLIGGTIYNTTDGSSGTITAVGGTNQDTITAALAGGAGNDWDNGDVSMIKPPAGWVWAEPIALRTGVNADIQVWLTNVSGEGVLTLHQVEIHESLLANGDHESLQGVNPELITGWANSGLDAGDTEPEAVVVHAGAQSLEWNTGAVGGEAQYYSAAVATVGNFYAAGVWQRGDGTRGLYFGTQGAGAYGALQHDTIAYYILGSNDAVWTVINGVWRATGTNLRMSIYGRSGAVGDRWSDDAYVIEMDNVTLTVTPRTYAASLETIAAIQSLSIDGYDLCTQPVANVTATRGRFRFRVLFRHDPAEWFDFGQALCPLIYQYENANNYIYVAITAADTIQLGYNAQGAGLVSGNWTPTGLAAETWYTCWVTYTAGYCRLTVDGVNVINLAGFAFAANPSVAVDWGNRFDNVFQLDGNIAEP